MESRLNSGEIGHRYDVLSAANFKNSLANKVNISLLTFIDLNYTMEVPHHSDLHCISYV